MQGHHVERVLPLALRSAAEVATLEARGDDSDAHLALTHALVDDGTEDDVRFLVGGFLDQRGGLVDLEEREVGAARDVDQNALGAFDGEILEQRARDRHACGRQLGDGALVDGGGVGGGVVDRSLVMWKYYLRMGLMAKFYGKTVS